VTTDECIRSRRSIRRYQPHDVPDSLVREILDLARHAPSSMNDQPCCFVIVRDGETKRRLAAVKNLCSPVEKRGYPADFLVSAPVVVAVCVEQNRAHDRERENGILATAMLLLAAHQRGLGGVYLSAYQPRDPALATEIRRLLALPREVEPVTLVPLGYPAESPSPKAMRPLATLVHDGAFDRGDPR
jgi:nitroreductase